MIEWVPIKDFKAINGVLYLFLHKHKTRIDKNPIVTSGVYKEEERYIFADYDMTHAATLNMPVEKTLEEKFAGYLRSQAVHMPESELLQLLQIAKEHYEGEKND